MTTIGFDVTRLFVRGSRFSPTGIDRVVMAYAQWLLAREDIVLEPLLTVQGRLLRLRRRVLADMIDDARLFARGPAPDANGAWGRLAAALADPAGGPTLRPAPLSRQVWPRLRRGLDLVGRSLAHLRPAAAARGSLYLNVSHTGLGDPDVLGRIGAAGARSVVMVHDLIPIHHPEYCSPAAEARHLRRLRQIVDHADHVIANSATTAREFVDHARARGGRVPAVTVAPLGLHPAFLAAVAPLAAARPYFVCVGTIEARKNLAFLLGLWRRLDERMGERAPRLVIVGRRGWEAESVIDHLDRSKSVRRLVHEICDLPDADLARLIAGAAGLISASFAEGFDLPVLEAQALRTPVIASRIPAHVEFARGARLVDPLDGPAWLEAIEAAADAPARGPAAQAPTWARHFEVVAEILGLQV